MEINKSDIPKIDQAFRNALLAPQEEADSAMALWENGLARKVAKQNFYKLGFAHFNIFKLSFIVVSVAVISITASYYFLKSSAPASPEMKNIPGTLFQSDSLAADSEDHSTETKNKETIYTREKKTTETQIIDSIAALPVAPSVSTLDTTLKPIEQNIENVLKENQPNELKPAEKKTVPVKIVKKTILIEKRDTLETVDTIRSKKEWRKASKNK